MGLIKSGRASWPSHRALIKILHASGASSPFAAPLPMVTEKSGTNGVAACLRLLGRWLWTCTDQQSGGRNQAYQKLRLLCAKRSTFLMTFSLFHRHDKMITS